MENEKDEGNSRVTNIQDRGAGIEIHLSNKCFSLHAQDTKPSGT